MEDIIKTAKYKDQQRWRAMMKKMDQKTELYKKLNSLLAAEKAESNRKRANK